MTLLAVVVVGLTTRDAELTVGRIEGTALTFDDTVDGREEGLTFDDAEDCASKTTGELSREFKLLLPSFVVIEVTSLFSSTVVREEVAGRRAGVAVTTAGDASELTMDEDGDELMFTGFEGEGCVAGGVTRDEQAGVMVVSSFSLWLLLLLLLLEKEVVIGREDVSLGSKCSRESTKAVLRELE